MSAIRPSPQPSPKGKGGPDADRSTSTTLGERSEPASRLPFGEGGRRLGEGNPDSPPTERANPATAHVDQMSAAEIVAAMSAEDEQVAAAVRSELPGIARAVELIERQLRAGGRLVYVGAGTSGRLGVLDASECPPTFSTPPSLVLGLIAGGERALREAVEAAEDESSVGAADVAAVDVGPLDAVVGITASGSTSYVLGALAQARAVGAVTIGLTCGDTPALVDLSDVVIAPRTGPEVIAGSTRLKAGTAQKMVLNMLSTATMVRLGKVYGNLMVDVKPTNRKLRRRACRIVSQVTGVSEDHAGELLERCDWQVKTALVAQLATTTPEGARTRLARVGGRVAEALGPVRGRR